MAAAAEMALVLAEKALIRRYFGSTAIKAAAAAMKAEAAPVLAVNASSGPTMGGGGTPAMGLANADYSGRTLGRMTMAMAPMNQLAPRHGAIRYLSMFGLKKQEGLKPLTLEAFVEP